MDLRPAANLVLRQKCATAGQRVIDIPPDMATAGRVRWIADQVTQLTINTGV